MNVRSLETSPQVYARLAGWLYLAVIIVGFFAEGFVRGRLVISGDAAATAQNIIGSQGLWRGALAAELVMLIFYVAITLILYALLRPVDRNLSLLAAFFSLMGCAVLAFDELLNLAPLILLGGADYLKAFDAQQLQALALLSVRLFENGYVITMIFFGCYCSTIGYLIFESGYFPKWLGVLLEVGGLSYVLNGLVHFAAPAFAVRMPDITVIGGVAELALCLWLVVMGVNASKWKQAEEMAPSSPQTLTASG